MKAARPRPRSSWMQNAEPLGLYCADETDGESLRACEQINESLYGYEIGGTDAEPALADGVRAQRGRSTWTCTLRDGVQFQRRRRPRRERRRRRYAAQWDAQHPLHVGRTGAFAYWPGLVGRLPQPAAAELSVRAPAT